MSSIDEIFAFYITNDDDIEVKFDFFKIENKKSHYLISLTNLEKDVRKILHKGSNYYISDGRYLIIEFFIVENSLNDENRNYQNIKIKVSPESGIQMYCDNFYANLVYSWRKNEKKYDWRNFKSEFKRRTWIYACSRLKSVNTEFVSNENIFINFENIKTENEMYCYLGEMFFGYRGYSGNNMYALKDCLLDVIELKKVKISISHFNSFRNRLKNHKDMLKYNIIFVDELIDVFDYYKMNYEILS